MIPSLTSYAQNTCINLYNNAPTAEQLVKNVNKVALPAIALIAASNLPIADAGPWFGSLMLSICLPLIEAPPLFAACLVAAGGAYGAPTP